MTPEVTAALVSGFIGGIMGAVSGGLVAKYTFDLQLKRDEIQRQREKEKEAADKISNDLQVGVKSSAQIVAATKIQNAINANRRG